MNGKALRGFIAAREATRAAEKAEEAGAARKYRPSYAARSAVGIFNVCHCQQCERDLGY